MVAAIRAVTVASISGVGVGVVVGSAADTAACTVASKSGVAVGIGGGVPASQAIASDSTTTAANTPQMFTGHRSRQPRIRQSPNPPSPDSDDFTSL
jgi:hypothetical protein